jgi:hypothetical protein
LDDGPFILFGDVIILLLEFDEVRGRFMLFFDNVNNSFFEFFVFFILFCSSGFSFLS